MRKLLLIASLFAAVVARAANPIISYVQISTGATQNGGFNTQTGSVKNSMNLPYVAGVQCLRSVNGVVSGAGADCGASLISGSSNTIIASPQFQIPFYASPGSTNTLLGASGFNWYGSSISVPTMVATAGTISPQYGVSGTTGLLQNINGGIGISSQQDIYINPQSGNSIVVSQGAKLAFVPSNGANRTSINSSPSAVTQLDFTLPASSGSANQFMTTDGNGTLFFSSAAVLSSTQTWTGANTFLSTTTMGNGAVVVYPTASPQQMSVTGPLALPSLLPNQCLQTDGSSRIVTSGASCGSGGGGGGGVTGTIVPSSQYAVGYYSLTGPTTTITGLSPATSGYVLQSAGTSFPPFFGPQATGIVSPGTFTWTNNFGLKLSTVQVSQVLYPDPISPSVIDGYSSATTFLPTGIGFYNSAGALVAQSMSSDAFGITTHGFSIANGGAIRFYDTGTHFTSFKASGTLTSSPEYTLPSIFGAEGSVFTLHADSSTSWNLPSNGYSIYPATATASFPFGLSASTIAVTSTATVQALALTGLGELNFTLGTDTTPYRVLGATQPVTAGHLGVWGGADNTLLDGGPVTAFANGPKFSVQVASGVLFSGSSAFQFNGSSLTLQSSMTINTGGVFTNSNPGLFNIDDGANPFVGKTLFSIGSALLGNQFTIRDHTPVDMSNYGAQLGGLQAGANASPDTIYDATHANNQSINFWNSGEMDIGTTDAPDGGRNIAFFPNTVETVIMSTGVTRMLSSATVEGAGGLGVTFGVLASTFNATAGVAFTQTYKAAVCQAGTASLGFSTFSSSGPTAACVISTSTVMGVAPFLDTSSMTVQDHFTLPSDWVGAVNANILWNSTTTANSVVWQIRTGCGASGSSSAVTWNSFSTVTDAAISPTNAINTAAITGISTSGCSAGNELFFEFLRDPTTAADTLTATANLITLQLTYRRTLTL